MNSFPSLKNQSIVLTSGGTGGHMFPLISLAQALKNQGALVTIITDERGGAYCDSKAFEIHVLKGGGIFGIPLWKKAHHLLLLCWGFVQTIKKLLHIKPQLVIGFGGYGSVVTMGASKLLNIDLMIHEQNAIMGRVNRLISPHCQHIVTSFENVKNIPEKSLNHMTYIGNPVRQSVVKYTHTPFAPYGENDPIRLCVLGGSQGARIFSDVVAQTLSGLPLALQKRLHVTQQCRPEDLERVQKIYEKTPIQATLSSFFNDMGEKMSQSHLIIARSGATTCSELIALKRPCILVPYPHAIDNHQWHNAQALKDMNLARVMEQKDFTLKKLHEQLMEIFSHQQTLLSWIHESKMIESGSIIPNFLKLLSDHFSSFFHKGQ